MTAPKPLTRAQILADSRLRRLYELARRHEVERQRMLKAKALFEALKDEHKR